MNLLRRESDKSYLEGEQFRKPKVGETWWVRTAKASAFVQEAVVLSFGKNTVKLCIYGTNTLRIAANPYNTVVCKTSSVEFVEFSRSPTYDTESVEKQFFNRK
jgi:hypothetical protein